MGIYSQSAQSNNWQLQPWANKTMPSGGIAPLYLHYLKKYSIMGQNTLVVAATATGVVGPATGCGGEETQVNHGGG